MGKTFEGIYHPTHMCGGERLDAGRLSLPTSSLEQARERLEKMQGDDPLDHGNCEYIVLYELREYDGRRYVDSTYMKVLDEAP